MDAARVQHPSRRAARAGAPAQNPQLGWRVILGVLLLASLCACGGGGGSTAGTGGSAVTTWDQMSWDVGLWA